MCQVITLILVEVPQAPLITFPGAEILGGLAPRPLTFAAREMRFDSGDDGVGDFILYRENVLQIAIVALGPKMFVVHRIDQLRRYAYPVAAAPHAALDHVAHAELPAHFLDFCRLTSEGKRGIARDDEQGAELGQFRDDVLADAVGEEVLLGIRAHIVEGQNGDGWFVGEHRIRREACPRRRALIAAGRHAGAPTINVNGFGDVFKILEAAVFELDVYFAGDLFIDRGGYADSPGLCGRFQARRQIDAFAEDFAPVFQDFADVDADAQAHLLLIGNILIAQLQLVLYRGGGIGDGHDTGELGENSVPGVT